MKKTVSNKAQSAIETMFAVLMLMGIFVVISLLSAQRAEINQQMVERDMNATLCDHLSYLIDRVGALSGNTEIAFSVEQSLNFKRQGETGMINFGPSGYYCYYLSPVSFDDGGSTVSDETGFSLSNGSYVLRKEGGSLVVESPA